MIRSIAFFIHNFNRPAGSERVTSIIANELAKQGFQIAIISVCGSNNSYYEIDDKIKLVTLIAKQEVNHKKNFLQILNRLKFFYKNNRVDLVIDVFASMSIYSILLKRKYGFKNITWEHFNYTVNTGLNRIGRQLAVRFSDQIVTLTETDKKYYEADNRIRGSIDYIYNPSPYQIVVIDQSRKNQVVSVGRLTFQKGFERLIKAWRIIENKCDWVLMIFGDGEEREKLQNLIDSAGIKRLKLMGSVKNIDEYYARAKIYVSTARFEGLPMTMIEAQSFGLPIISFDYETGPKEIVTDGSDGIIIPKDEENVMIKAFAKELLALINDEKRIAEYSNKALISANRFKLDEIMDKWEKVLEKMNNLGV